MGENVTTIPYDIYESENEIVVILPLGGVSKESVDVKLNQNILSITGKRVKPELKDDLVAEKQECYWGEFQAKIQIPLTVYFDRIKALLNKENILMITVPKYRLPDDVKLSVEVLT